MRPVRRADLDHVIDIDATVTGLEKRHYWQRVYRRYSYGPLLELFVLDMRSYRGPNSANLQTTAGAQTAFLGDEQLDWLKQGLEDSQAVWKVIAADMPLGLNVGDGTTPQELPQWEAVANGEPGSPKGSG